MLPRLVPIHSYNDVQHLRAEKTYKPTTYIEMPAFL